MNSTRPKLKKVHKEFIISKLAAWETSVDIVEALQSEFGVTVARQNIDWYRNKKQKEIEVEREKLRSKIMSTHKLANKFMRLSELEELFYDLKNNLWVEKYLMRSGKIQTDSEGNPIVHKLEGQHDVMRKILETIAKEVDPIQGDISLRERVLREIDATPEVMVESEAYKILADAYGIGMTEEERIEREEY